MWLARSAIKRPVLTAVAVIIVLVMGFVALNDLQMDLLPDIQPPVGAVVASLSRGGLEEVLEKVTQPLEKQLGTLPGLKNIQSQTREGLTLVLLEFEWSQDINQLQNDVISRINQTSLPDDVDTPSFLKFDPSTFPIVQMSVMTKGTSDKQLREDIDRISQSLSQLPGVASADASSLREQQIQISLDADQMKKYHLSQSAIQERIQATEISQPGGIIHKGDQDLTARVSSELTSLKQFRELELAVDPRTGKKITLDDVADVRIAKEEENIITRTNNKPSIGINVFKQSGANTAEVSQDVRIELDKLSKELDVDTQIIFDQGKYVDMSIQNVSNSMVMGGILAMLVLFLFLRSFRSPLIIGVAIPISVITTFVLMYLSNFTLNIMTLGGLALGIGMLVDNAIVVIRKYPPALAAGRRTQASRDQRSRGSGGGRDRFHADNGFRLCTGGICQRYRRSAVQGVCIHRHLQPVSLSSRLSHPGSDDGRPYYEKAQGRLGRTTGEEPFLSWLPQVVAMVSRPSVGRDSDLIRPLGSWRFGSTQCRDGISPRLR